MYCSQWGFGYLVPFDKQQLPLEVQSKVEENKGRALYFRGADFREPERSWVVKGTAVDFQVYIDRHHGQGAGACDLRVWR